MGPWRPRCGCWKSFQLRPQFVWDVLSIKKQFISIASILQEALQMSERNRLAEQKKFSPVWNLRREPPRDWHMPLNHEKPQDSWTVSVNQRSSVPWRPKQRRLDIHTPGEQHYKPHAAETGRNVHNVETIYIGLNSIIYKLPQNFINIMK